MDENRGLGMGIGAPHPTHTAGIWVKLKGGPEVPWLFQSFSKNALRYVYRHTLQDLGGVSALCQPRRFCGINSPCVLNYMAFRLLLSRLGPWPMGRRSRRFPADG